MNIFGVGIKFRRNKRVYNDDNIRYASFSRRLGCKFEFLIFEFPVTENAVSKISMTNNFSFFLTLGQESQVEN